MKNFLLRVFISAAFLGLLFYLIRGDIPEIAQVLKRLNRPLCAVSVLIFLSTAVVLARRLELIFAAKDIRLGLRETVNLTFVGYFFNNFLPTSVGGDIVKAMCVSRLTGNAVSSVTSVLLDRLFGLFTFIFIPGLSFLFFLKEIRNPAVPALIYSLLASSLFCFVILFNRDLARRFGFVEVLLNRIGIGPKIRKIYDEIHGFRHHRGVIAEAMALSVIGQSVSIVALYLLARALGAQAPILYFFLLVPVVHLVSMLPSLNGLGIREGAYVYFLTPVIGREYAAAISVLWLGLLFLLSVIGGLIYFFRHDYHIRFTSLGKEATP
ncbi:MAG: flippase-like domain-containing protein [Candidatus Omnitrophica bacterium]|nr:flippase-like domain-containing protein [Candidatus Omnitrophota bacterium]